MARLTYNQKLNDSRNFPVVKEITDIKQALRHGGPKMLIAPPLAYDAAMRAVPFGRVITADAVRTVLAKAHGADFTCPLTAGIFINVAAHASAERGTFDTPYWRTLKAGGELNEKYPGGIDDQKLRLEAEGHRIEKRGARWFVADYKEKTV
jgi:alkylated DNA nucleotide flippase Atl1